jgi:Peptidase family M1 domain
MRIRTLFACALFCLVPAAFGPAPARAQEDGITRLVFAMEQAMRAGDAPALRAFGQAGAPAAFDDFVQSTTTPRPTAATVKERDRAPVNGERGRLLLEILTVHEREARVTSWRMDVVPSADGTAWQIADVERLTVISGLYRLTLDTTVEYAVRDLTIKAPDLSITFPSAFAYAATTPDGPTGFVIVGRGRATLAPSPASERGQLRLFSGEEVFKSEVTALFVRVNPSDVANRLTMPSLTPHPADARRARRAVQVFDAYAPKSFEIDLNDLSADNWSLVPTGSDFVAEIETPRFGSLTYARANAEPEDISFFDRRRKRNIAVYASGEKMATRGRFYSEDDRVDYDVRRYDLDVGFAPDRSWVEGTATLSIHTHSYLSTLTLRLAEPLVIRSVVSKTFGRLLHLRVVGQSNVLIGFPGTVPADTDMELTVTYGGRLLPQGLEREAVSVQAQERQQEEIAVPTEPYYLYSNRAYWYPQGPVSDYAKAKLTITIPGGLDVIASGTQQGTAEMLPAPPGQHPRRKLLFEATEPTRYLAVLISRFQFALPQPLKLIDDKDSVTLTVAANPHQFGRVRAMAEKASDVLRFYSSLIGDMPYDTFTLALTESDLPGGHSPAYFALLNQPRPMAQQVWTNDPVSFQTYPSFFIAHELAHQWWGQAVGWKNYHEQWLSEGFAQYFAALYAEHEKGQDTFVSVLKQMRRFAIDMSPQGPVYLGYRLGHLKGDSRIFRALVYNKGAMVLQMLRRLCGDEAFFSGLRDYYATWRYKKAGTDDFRAAMEKATGRKLDRFFDRWIYGDGIPTLRFSSTVSASGLRVRFDQGDDVYDVPVTVTLNYADGTSEDVVVPVTEKTVEREIPLKRALRSFDLNKDGTALAEILR